MESCSKKKEEEKARKFTGRPTETAASKLTRDKPALKSSKMRLTVCAASETDPSTHVVTNNNTFVQYTCRAGYKLESGELQRSCDANGTWSGSQPICTVDSILPKAYLVILIVGATIAVFLACIPYDFYRFRKRKKKVRDHQERLSLVTRIAPGHAKVILETVPAEQNPPGQLQGRRFGLKSLFSVFRFVGGKMRSPQGQTEATSPICSDEKNDEYDLCTHRPSVSDVGIESDGATASSYVFSPQLAPPCLASHGHIDFCPVVDDNEIYSKDRDTLEQISVSDADDDLRPRSSSPLVFNNNDVHSSGTQAKKGFQMFKKANEALITRELSSLRNTVIISNRRSVPCVDNPLLSEPATVEVTSMNEASSPLVENPRSSSVQEEFPTPKVSSASSSTSSPDVASLRRGDSKVENFRTLHYPTGKNSVAYHSMPTITDIP